MTSEHDLSRGSVELYLSRQDGRHVVRLWDHVLELGTVRAVVDELGRAVDLLDDLEMGATGGLDLSRGEVELVVDLQTATARLWERDLDLDDARDVLDGLGDALDTADELELADHPEDGEDP